MTVLIDTSFLLATMYTKDQNYTRAIAALKRLKTHKTRIIPGPVVHELFFMTMARINYERAVKEFELLPQSGFTIENLMDEDMRRMVEIMRQYASASFDYADVAIMALSERLNIRQVYTFDQRDFSIFRPRHYPYLELLPAPTDSSC
jgi:predicted nucleic acid-binding protein